MSQKPLPLGEVSPKVTERARTLTEMSEHSDNIALIKAFDYRCIPSLLSHACPLRRSAPALPKGEPLTEGVHSMKSERSYPIYKVNKKAEASLVGGHPWVYENDILEFPETEPENGTLADVVSPKGAYLGTGFVSLKSKIRVRLISRNANDTFDASFWRRRVEYAWAYRKTVLEPADLSACRVIFGEADQFPGLTVDRFNNILVTQTLSVGMEKIAILYAPPIHQDML